MKHSLPFFVLCPGRKIKEGAVIHIGFTAPSSLKKG